MMKKYIPLILVVSMAMMLFTGCQETQDAPAEMQKDQEQMLHQDACLSSDSRPRGRYRVKNMVPKQARPPENAWPVRPIVPPVPIKVAAAVQTVKKTGR